jgi:hypothetical protein
MAKLIVSEASRAFASEWFASRHYTGTFGGTRAFMCRADDAVVAVVAVGRGGNRFGVGDKFGLGKWRGDIEITRVACEVDAPRNTASKAVAAVLRVLAGEGLDWVFTYADSAHGHHGGIYQALNAVYVGTDAKQWVNFELDGRRVAKRAISGRFGHTRWPEVADLAAAAGHVLKKVPWAPKHTYILPISGDAKTRRAMVAHLRSLALPYPKRGEPVIATPYRNHRPKADA